MISSDLNKHIDSYAEKAWGVKPQSIEERAFFAHVIRNIPKEGIQFHPQKEIIQKAKNAMEQMPCFSLSVAPTSLAHKIAPWVQDDNLVDTTANSATSDKAKNQPDSPKADDAAGPPLVKADDQSDSPKADNADSPALDKAENEPKSPQMANAAKTSPNTGVKKTKSTWVSFKEGIGRKKAIYGGSLSEVRGDLALGFKPAPNIAGACLGMIGTIVKGGKYIAKKVQIGKLESQIKSLVATQAGTTGAVSLEIGSKIENLRSEIATRKKDIEQLKEARTAAFLSVTGFSSNVAQYATAGKAIAVVKIGAVISAAVGGIAFGAVMTFSAIKSMRADAHRVDRLNVEIGKLVKQGKSAKSGSIKEKLIFLRRDNLATTQRKNLWMNGVRDIMFSTLGLVAMGMGVLTLLGATASGVGLAVIVGLTITTLVGIGLHKLWKIRKGKIGDVVKLQKEVVNLQEQVSKKLKANGGDIHELIQLNDELQKKKIELGNAKLQHKVKYQASDDGKFFLDLVFKRIDEFRPKYTGSTNDADYLKYEKDIRELEEITGFKILDSLNENNFDDQAKLQLKSKLANWITNPDANIPEKQEANEAEKAHDPIVAVDLPP